MNVYVHGRELQAYIQNAAGVNRAKSSKVQVGLLNFNDNGFLPFFPFFNLDKSLFD